MAGNPRKRAVNETASLCRSCEMNEEEVGFGRQDDGEELHRHVFRESPGWPREAAAIAGDKPKQSNTAKVDTDSPTCPSGVLTWT